MGYILSIETAATTCSVAIHHEGELVATSACHIPKAHNRVIGKMARDVLELADISIKAVEAIAVSYGPGSYTGLRIGLSVAKGVAYGRNIPLIIINSLSIMIKGALPHLPKAGNICALMDAGRERAYRMVANAEGEVIAETDICALTPESLAPWIGSSPLYIAGSGAERYVALCKASPGIQLIKDVYPNAADMGKIAYEKFIQKAWANTAYVEPLYLNALSKSVHKTPLQK